MNSGVLIIMSFTFCWSFNWCSICYGDWVHVGCCMQPSFRHLNATCLAP